MQTDIKKNLLGNVNVRTMKKDIQRLREVDTIQESRKIFTAKPVEPVVIPAPLIKPVTKKEPTPNLEKAGQYANETEKQRIFSWQSDKKGLEAQLQTVTTKKQQLDLQKDNLLTQQKGQEAKLAPFTQKAAVASEDEKDALEKQTWPIQQELHSITVQLDTLSQEYGKLTQQEQTLIERISTIETSLTQMYAGIVKRGLQEKSVAPPPITPPIQTPAPPAKEKAYVQEISPAFKEKLKAVENTDQARKKSFMEEVESWGAPTN